MDDSMGIDPSEFEKIAEMIHSDESPVGFDAKRTHVYILHLLQRIEKRIAALEASASSQ